MVSSNFPFSKFVALEKEPYSYGLRKIFPNKYKKESYNNNHSHMLVMRLLFWQDVYYHK